MRCAGAASSALATLALVALLPSTPSVLCGCEPDTIAPTAEHPSCKELAKRNHNRFVNEGERCVSVEGQPASVTLYWGSDPARAAAVLLRVQLRDVLHYRRVRTAHGPHGTAEFARNVSFYPAHNYTDLVIGVSTAWEPKEVPAWLPGEGQDSGLAGPRLAEFGISPVTARRLLHVKLANATRELDACHQHTHWSSYANATVLALCGFVDVHHRGNVSAAELLVVGECNATLQRLQERAAAAKMQLRPSLVNRTILIRNLRTANHSFLFLDYDIWEEEPGVRIVDPPPCVSGVSDNSTCQQDLDPTIAMRVADVIILQTYAPQLFKFVHDFKPPPKLLRQILEKEANGLDIEEAACESMLEREKYKNINKSDDTGYVAAIYLCSNDTDIATYDKIISYIGQHIYERTIKAGYGMSLPRYYINCSDAYHMSKRLDEKFTTVGVYKLVGVVSQAVVGAAAAAAAASAHRVPLLLTNIVPDDDAATSSDATWRVAGRPRHIARALQHFVLESNWTRVAVLSQPTTLARHYFAALQDEAKFLLRDHTIPLKLTKLQAKEALQKLQVSNARIVFVNADSEAAAVILTAALEHGMSYADGFVWIVRDWRPNNVTSSTTHFTVSPWSRCEEGIPREAGQHALRAKLNTVLEDHEWPQHAVSLADALLTLADGFTDVFRRYPGTRHDLHTALVIRSFNERLIEKPVTGINQRLHYNELRSIEEIFVFVDKWRGDKFSRLATWRVNASSGAVRGNDTVRAIYALPTAMPRDDGASRCIARGGDPFDPDCYDAAWACALLILALAPAALLLARRLLHRRLAQLEREQKIEVIARRRHVAAVLAAYLVERDALELRQELGAGRFGSVRLALLRAPTHASRYIAAKALRDNAAPAEESEFLREACTIASLDHKHIVRLVGVCIADGPPLVLMELAFFGDLLGYLRTRRHLAEGADSEALTANEEAAHVSAEALTRLAREAAEALEYLGSRGVVHRDVRAANCLVDARRSLKLADFGMARDTVAGGDGAPEYACRRRGLFPVLWMAPESLAHGVFSAASDMWALGVLVLELVTLGARPYGDMSPLRVLEYVAAGGRPPLPLDATPQTRGLARLCWQRAADRRPSAAEVAAYLAARPHALRPALLSEREEPADADSGFGESPSTELLPPDSPLHSLDQLEVLAATH